MGSIPTTPVLNIKYGGCGEVVNTSDCGSDMRGFDSHHPPLFLLLNINMADVVKWLTHRIVVPTRVGSIPIIRLFYFWAIAKR